MYVLMRTDPQALWLREQGKEQNRTRGTSSCAGGRRHACSFIRAQAHLPGRVPEMLQERLPLGGHLSGERGPVDGSLIFMGLPFEPFEYSTTSEKSHLLHQAFPDCQSSQ